MYGFQWNVFVILVSTFFPRSNGILGILENEWKPEKFGDVVESTLVRYYVFSLNNPEEFAKGEIPEMTELGPFTYREKRIKQNLARLSESTLQYDIHWSMHFLPELTKQGLNEHSQFTGLNVPIMTLGEGLNNVGLPKNFNDILIEELEEAGEKLYREGIELDEMLFSGYNVSLYTDIVDDITQGQAETRYPELANGKFAFFKNKNNTVTANYTIESTKDTPFGRILTYKGSPTLGFWGEGTSCNNVEGSLDFFALPKHISKDTTLDIFLPENCRSVKMTFVQEDVFRGIPVYVFKFPLEQFSNGEDSPGHESCYCHNFYNVSSSSSSCLDAGLMDYSGCSKGAPLLGSFPHFLHAHPRHLKNVKGIMPNKSIHESEVMIEPITGTPLYAVRRFQLNVKMHPLESVTFFQNMTERIIPLAWTEHILEVPSSTFEAVKEKLENMKKMSDKDIYEHDVNPIDEMDDNSLFASRSGFAHKEQTTNSSLTSDSSSSFAQGELRHYAIASLLCIFRWLSIC